MKKHLLALAIGLLWGGTVPHIATAQVANEHPPTQTCWRPLFSGPDPGNCKQYVIENTGLDNIYQVMIDTCGMSYEEKMFPDFPASTTGSGECIFPPLVIWSDESVVGFPPHPIYKRIYSYVFNLTPIFTVGGVWKPVVDSLYAMLPTESLELEITSEWQTLLGNYLNNMIPLSYVASLIDDNTGRLYLRRKGGCVKVVGDVDVILKLNKYVNVDSINLGNPLKALPIFEDKEGNPGYRFMPYYLDFCFWHTVSVKDEATSPMLKVIPTPGRSSVLVRSDSSLALFSECVSTDGKIVAVNVEKISDNEVRVHFPIGTKGMYFVRFGTQSVKVVMGE